MVTENAEANVVRNNVRMWKRDKNAAKEVQTQTLFNKKEIQVYMHQ